MLPKSDRVVFDQNPLFSVTAQIRFPTILKIQVEVPMSLQEAIRRDYPLYTVAENLSIDLPSEVPPQVQNLVRANLQRVTGATNEVIHRFSTADQNWTVQLSQGFLQLNVKQYPRWEEFRDKFSEVFTVFQSLYLPAFCLSVGLRYQNAISRDRLSMQSVPWRDLLRPYISAELAAESIEEDEVISSGHRFELKLEECKVKVQHGIGTNKLSKERIYIIDNEFGVDMKVENTNVLTQLDKLNGYSGRLFRSYLTERLFKALQPHGV
jgi:uncharacterized protein (TIGR04255 family)